MLRTTLILCLWFGACIAGLPNLDDLNEKEFEEYFDLPPVDDPEEYKKRDDALKKNIDKIKKVNEGYKKGEYSWFDAVNEFDDLFEDEFITDHTGVIVNDTLYRTGSLPPTPEDRIDEISEMYFDLYRYETDDDLPAYFNSRDLGHVSPVKGQRSCGSCVAFATVAAIETCLARVTNKIGDYSEQQLMDCGHDNACGGAVLSKYGRWLRDEEPLEDIAHESQYPYKAETSQCIEGVPGYNMGARISGFYHTFRGDEDLLKQLLIGHGAVMTNVNAEFKNYAGGVFAGCTHTKVNHAVVVVGYGTENGMDYWLVKNSWGPYFAENGFIKIQRGVRMCGIGKHLGVFECSPTTGPTDAPLPEYCEDRRQDCENYVKKDKCWKKSAQKNCKRSCGLCKE